MALFQRAMAQGQLALDIQEGQWQRAAHVDKRQFVDDLMALDSKLYNHREHAAGRASFLNHKCYDD